MNYSQAVIIAFLSVVFGLTIVSVIMFGSNSEGSIFFLKEEKSIQFNVEKKMIKK
jgi:hypothetical protein